MLPLLDVVEHVSCYGCYRLDSVLDAYVSFMFKMLDQLNPKKMFENLDWLKPPAT